MEYVRRVDSARVITFLTAHYSFVMCNLFKLILNIHSLQRMIENGKMGEVVCLIIQGHNASCIYACEFICGDNIFPYIQITYGTCVHRSLSHQLFQLVDIYMSINSLFLSSEEAT